ncbi:hypothetical protein B0H11DRAFT_2256067 [Mycena galericulata]|nr:hypothetical protein B0H11DRAFT_2256067 [Mycena galericulata]
MRRSKLVCSFFLRLFLVYPDYFLVPRGGFVAGSALRAHRGPVAVRTSSLPSLSSSVRTLILVVREEADQRTTGLDVATWGVLLLLTHLHSLTISYPCDLAAGLAAWLIPRNVRALTLDYAATPRDPVPFLNQLHPGGQPPELRYVAMPDLSPRNAPQSSSTGYRQCGLWAWACVLAHLARSRRHDDSRVPVGVEKRVPGVTWSRINSPVARKTRRRMEFRRSVIHSHIFIHTH